MQQRNNPEIDRRPWQIDKRLHGRASRELPHRIEVAPKQSRPRPHPRGRGRRCSLVQQHRAKLLLDNIGYAAQDLPAHAIQHRERNIRDSDRGCEIQQCRHALAAHDTVVNLHHVEWRGEVEQVQEEREEGCPRKRSGDARQQAAQFGQDFHL